NKIIHIQKLNNNLNLIYYYPIANLYNYLNKKLTPRIVQAENDLDLNLYFNQKKYKKISDITFIENIKYNDKLQSVSQYDFIIITNNKILQNTISKDLLELIFNQKNINISNIEIIIDLFTKTKLENTINENYLQFN